MITTAAHEINQGETPHLEPREGQERDFFFIDRPDPGRALDTVVEVVAERAPGRYGVDPIRDVQVLAPMYRGAVGIDALNERLQAQLNPDGRRALNDRFRVGDRLIQTRNSHDLGLMNGSIVFLREDDPEEEEIVVDTDDGPLKIPYGETGTLRLAYAISVHKAQGCEVPIVVAVCHRSHARMLTRPLVYTAITRARRACVVVGDPGALAMAVRRDEGGGRHSGLAAAPARLERRTPRYCPGWRRRDRRRPRSRPPLGGIVLMAAAGGRRSSRCAKRRRRRSAATPPRSAATSTASASAGPLLILALALLHSFVFYPAEIVDAAAGFLYGFFPALALAMTGWLLSGLICFAIGRSLARPLLDRWFGEERFERIEATIERGGATLLLAMRLIPILPFSLVSYAAGAARVPTWRFIWTTAVGYLPITALAVYFGTKLEGLSLTDPIVLGSPPRCWCCCFAGHRIARRHGPTASRPGS